MNNTTSYILLADIVKKTIYIILLEAIIDFI